MGDAAHGADAYRLYHYYGVGALLRLYRQHLARVGRLGLLQALGQFFRADLSVILGDLVFCFAYCHSA